MSKTEKNSKKKIKDKIEKQGINRENHQHQRPVLEMNETDKPLARLSKKQERAHKLPNSSHEK